MATCFCGANVWCIEDVWGNDDARWCYYCNRCGRKYLEEKYIIMSMVQKIESGTADKVTFDWGIDLT